MEEPITTLVGGRRASDRGVNALLRLLLVLNQLERVAGVVAHEEKDLGRVLDRTHDNLGAPRLQRRRGTACIGHFEGEMLDPVNGEVGCRTAAVSGSGCAFAT